MAFRPFVKSNPSHARLPQLSFVASFYEFHPKSGSFEVNPPFDPTTVNKMLRHVKNLLLASRCSPDPLSFVIVLPKLSDVVDACQDNNRDVGHGLAQFVSRWIEIDEANFYVGMQHTTTRKFGGSKNLARGWTGGTTMVIFAQNEAAMRIWPATDGAVEELKGAFGVSPDPTFMSDIKRSVTLEDWCCDKKESFQPNLMQSPQPPLLQQHHMPPQVVGPMMDQPPQQWPPHMIQPPLPLMPQQQMPPHMTPPILPIPASMPPGYAAQASSHHLHRSIPPRNLGHPNTLGHAPVTILRRPPSPSQNSARTGTGARLSAAAAPYKAINKQLLTIEKLNSMNMSSVNDAQK